MTTTESSIFEKLIEHGDDAEQMLQQAIAHFRENRQPMELFEAIKMQIRQRLGMPLIAGEDEPARSEDVERQLEAGLLDGCREAGTMLIEDGRIAEGWMYLRPLADPAVARRLLQDVEINDDNYDDMIQVLLHEGVDIGRGYQAVLQHQGTCNSITLFEQSIAGRSKRDRQAAAEKLLLHFYDELSSMVRDDIERRDEQNPKALKEDGTPQSLGEMVQERKWLLAEGGYHLDTTHLAATIRIASVLDDPKYWSMALELTQYGRRLHHQFQYPGEEPFVDFYPAYAAFYDVLLGNNVEAGLKLFERKTQTVDPIEHGTGTIETYVDLLDRIGRHREAVEAALRLVPEDVAPQQIVSMLVEIAAKSKDPVAFDAILKYCELKNDVLGYTAVTHAKSTVTT